MKTKQLILEAEGATVAFAFGRFNPAHQGHIEVWRTVEQAGKNWFIGTNPSTLGPNDPLTFQQKSAWMTEIYPPIQGHIVPEQSVLTLAAYIFKKLRKNESATVAYITDAQDWAWSGKLLNQYNGVEGSHGYYKFAEITHVPSPRVSSATALRDAARADDKVAFYHASGTDPKSKVSGLTYFDTVKQACEKYPVPVKRGQKVKEQEISEGYGRYYCSTDKKWKERKGPKQTRRTSEAVNPAQQAAIAIAKKKKKGITEMDKSQTPPGRDGGYSGGTEGTGKPLTVKQMKARAEKVLTKSMGDAEKKTVHNKFNHKPDDWSADFERRMKPGVAEEKQRLDPKCWDGYKKQGTKMKGGVRVNNCVKESALDEKSVSKAQFRTMAAVANNPEFAKKVGISQEVGKEFHSADKNTNYKKLPKKVDEILDPTSMSATVIRYLGRITAKAFPMIMVGAVGSGLAYAGLLAPIIASMGGITAALGSLSAEVMAAHAVGGAVGSLYAVPSLVQIVKDLFAADEDSLRAGFKRWVEKHVGDENDVLEFMNLHAQSAYLKQPVFRWRAEEWKTKMKPDEAEAYLEKHNKGWLDAEKQKVIDAEKAKAEKEKADAEKANVKPGVKPSGTPVKPGFKPPVKPATESLDTDQKRVGQVGGKDKARQIGQVLAKPTKQHPYKGRLVGEAEDFNGEYDDEAGMARSNLLTTGRAVAGLLKTIQDQDNLPEWGQEKIAKAEMMLVSIWDYLQSQKAQGIDPKIESVSEAKQDFGADWDEIVKRVGQRAKQGPLKTVWDPEKRVYKNVPVNDPDQPAKEVDEASLATMRDYFAGNDDAKDPTKLAQMRDFFNKNKLPGAKVQDKRFASKHAYELWLQKNGLRDLSSK